MIPAFRVGLFAVLATMAVSLSACDRRSGVGGAWELRGVHIVALKWDSSARRYKASAASDTISSGNLGYFVILDDAGRVVEVFEEFMSLSDWGSRALVATPSDSGLQLTGLGKEVRTGSDSSCGFLTFCQGDTIAFFLRRPLDRQGNRVPDSTYIPRARNVSFWRKAESVLQDIELSQLARTRARLDSVRTRGVDPALVTHVRSIGQLLGELALVYAELPPSETDPSLVPTPPPPPPMEGIFPAIRFVREALTTRSADGDPVAPRARQLLRRLDEIEQTALELWRSEGALRQRAESAYGYDFPAMEIFAGK